MAKAKKTGRKRGRQPRISKAQIEFLTPLTASWEEARVSKDKTAMTRFYDSVTAQFLEKFPDVDLHTTIVPPSKTPQFVFEPTVNLENDPSSSGGTSGPALPTPTVTEPGPTSATSDDVTPPGLSTSPATPPNPGDLSLIDPALRDSQPATRPTPGPTAEPTALNKNVTQRSDVRHVRISDTFRCFDTHALQFLVSWFHHHSRKIVRSDAQELIASIADAAIQKPVKDRVLVAYQRKHYDDRIRSRFDQYLAEAMEQWESSIRIADENGADPPKKPVPISIRNTAAKDSWTNESDAFREQFIAEMESEYNDALDLFMNRKQSPSTPEDYHK